MVSLRQFGHRDFVSSLLQAKLDGRSAPVGESPGLERPLAEGSFQDVRLDLSHTGGGESAAASDLLPPVLMAANSAPVIDFVPAYSSDFESPDDAEWVYYTFGDDLPDVVPRGDDGTGNHSLVSQGPWWTDPNHIFPGAGRLHLLSTIYVDGTHDGPKLDDWRDVTLSFDIRADQLVIPDGAHLYLWIQGLDPTIPWGMGQYVNYANTSVEIEDLLVSNGWAHVSITLSLNEADWLALGSNPDREGTYSKSSSVLSLLSGDPIDMGLIMLLGNGTPTTEASGTIRIDNVVIEHGDVLRLKFAPDALIAGLQPLHVDVDISDPDVTTFQDYSITVGYQGGGLAGETLGFAFAPDSGLSLSGGDLFLNAVQIGTVSGGTSGTELLVDITAPVAASVLDAIVEGFAYRNQNAVAGGARDLLIGLDDGQGGTASATVEVIARLPIDDGSGNDHLIGSGVNETLNGGTGADWLEGRGGDDRLDGGQGIDLMAGSTGDDWYFIDSVSDVIVEATGEGTLDRVFASVSYALKPGVEVEILSTVFNASTAPIDLTGNEFANAIFGNAGANRLTGGGGADSLIGMDGNDNLDGGTGADIMVGGNGDDWYFVDNSGDLVTEAVGGGTADRVFTSVSYTLTAGAQVEIMSTTFHTGTDAINLTGNEFANVIYGNAGNNQLTGGLGADTLIGGAGNDWYFLDNAGDVVSEAAGAGADRIFAAVSYALAAGAEVETMSTAFNPGTEAINLTGNELANVIFGNAGVNRLTGGGGADTLVGNEGNDILDGGTGADSLLGGTGDDWFYVDNTGDVVTEASGGGTDRVFASLGYTLAAGAQVEALSTTNHAGTAALDLTGNEVANTIYGNAGANVLDGKGGSDLLVGMAGADTFAFTTALGTGNVDRISDFASGSDRIALDDAVFAQVGGLGTLGAAAFHVGGSAGDLDDRIVYNSVTGQLFYDADGSGAGAAVQFATLDNAPLLAASDFTVI